MSVVIYKTMSTFNEMKPEDVTGLQIFLGFLSFFSVSLGGLAIGLLMGIITSLITRTTNEVRGESTNYTNCLVLAQMLDYYNQSCYNEPSFTLTLYSSVLY